MSKEFLKYKERGDYHWEEYDNQTIYGRYADVVKDWIKEDDILDIGSGDGLITYLIKGVGIDDNDIAVKLAREHGVKVSFGSAYDIPYEDNSFEAVFMGDVLEHLETPDLAIKEVKRVLKKGGRFYVTTPPAREDRILQDIYHYREYTKNELVNYLKDFKLLEPIKTEYGRMFAKFQK